MVQSLCSDTKIHVDTIDKPLFVNHKNKKKRSHHVASTSFTIPLCELSFPQGFVGKKQQSKIFKKKCTPDGLADNMNFRWLLILICFLLSPLILPAQTSQFFVQQGLFHYELQEYDEAIRNFETALRFPNPGRDLYVYLVSSQLLNQNADEAINIAREGLQEYPDFLRLRVMKGEALIQTDLKRAIPLFEEVWKNMEQSGITEQDGIRKEDVGRYISRLYQQVAAEAFEANNFRVAANFYHNALPYDPQEIQIHNNLAYVLIQLEEWGEADRAIKTGLRRFPGSENLLLMQAQVHEQQENSDALMITLREWYETDPSNMNRAVLYGRSLLNANRANEANIFFMEKIEAHPRERILYETLLEMNRQRFNSSGILEVLRMKMEQFPGEMKIEEEYGLELITVQLYEEANAWFDSLAMAYNEPEFGRLAAHAWLFDEEYERAETEYRKQLERWPGDLSLMGDFGRVLIKNGRTDEAIEVLRAVLEKQPNDYLQYLYAGLLPSSPEKEGAIALLSGTIYQGRVAWMLIKESDSNLRRTDAEELSDVLMSMLRFVEKRQTIVQKEAQIGLEVFRSSTPPLFQTATELRESSREVRELLDAVRSRLRFDDALLVLNRALKSYPESALLLHHKGVLWIENGDLEEALAYLSEAATLEPAQWETHFYLGNIYRETEQFDRAVLSYERVIAIDPENRQAYRSLINIHQINGKMDQLSNRWLQRYQHQMQNDLLREFLVEALHRSERFEEAREVMR